MSTFEPLDLPQDAPGRTSCRRSRIASHVFLSRASSVQENEGVSSPSSCSATPSSASRSPRVRRTLISRDSQHAFAHPEQTIFVFDWDDTLFPTTSLTEDSRIDIMLRLDQQPISRREIVALRTNLQRLEGYVERILNSAVLYGRVVIVTLASEPWVQIACNNFFPKIGALLHTLGIQVVYARTLSADVPSPDTESEEEITKHWTAIKQHAITKEIAAFYAESGSSWKNVISIGDSNFERLATQGSITAYASSKCDSPRGVLSTENMILKPSQSKSRSPDNHAMSGWMGLHYRRVRCKTVKLVGYPELEDFQTALSLVLSWIPSIVKYDGGFDVDLEEDDALFDFHYELTGTKFEHDELARNRISVN